MGARCGIRDLQRPKNVRWEEETLTNTYGKCIAEPFEPGIATTVGNTLRRMLLSYIEGAAVTSVKIEGALHEFSTVIGMKEDVMDLLMNIKQLCLRIQKDASSKHIFLNVEGERDVTAADIECPSGIEVINKDLYLATLDTDGKLQIDMEVDNGYGYVLAQDNKRDGLPVGTIILDSFFSPVIKVAYKVEGVRVGQVTNYEKLILDVWTNGTIIPQDAIAYAAKILKDHLAIFINFSEVEEKEIEDDVDREEERVKTLLCMTVEELELSVRSANCLKSSELNTIGELITRTEQEMLKTRNFGKKSLTEIKEKLRMYNLTLGMKEYLPLMEKLNEE
ncbi:DNA-directed RNA polymerase subunit alpha [Candidatus Desantisbacteria bacterium CG2_30_40_21]|uniref:DNA-directed RNA polymerase subunit alpha n=3 Tax=unclassified Candidatus Desantisiibacteriota TaxID=3106372 RepID=A0A2M8AVJ5_9BACT|nr:MAG: DNA-directed RNA polymerase subunit alpha [Candidatus Desantisbacteria bacterium CG2_30_40_21]PIP39653.1 MAG: DNA-directed RNA polymerase subunit alpha [Candidatus Desantisbacteria bacterium CG23_combo_of_CG06-09_8_20_14_all_40_23]PJB30192.1 MAG: DNA-directed RNA polymerase subunit alpha [Candidatus Desantisbacteria bacterium CG_4_9_14_3_um_filter_40_11]